MGEPADAEIRSRLQDILAREVFHPADDFAELRAQLAKILAFLKPWRRALEDFLDGIPLPLAWVLVFGFVVLLGTALWKMHELTSVRRKRLKARKRDGERMEAGDSPEALLQRARALAATGAVRDAGRTLQQAVLLKLCNDRHLTWEPTLADWEWLNLLRPDAPVVAFTRRVQLLAYGPSATRELYSACEREATDLVHAHRSAP